MAIRHIFCFGDNPRIAAIAGECGWELGARSDGTVSRIPRPLALLDCEWRKPDWDRHLKIAREFRPSLGVAPDVMTEADLPLALARAEELAACCEAVMIVPKAYEVIERIPERIGGRPVVLGCSVATSYGGTCLPLWEFGRRPVHLLGGSPRRQREAAAYLNVISADGNMAWRLAQRGVVYGARGESDQTLREMDGQRFPGHGPQEALRRSLMNLRQFWARH